MHHLDLGLFKYQIDFSRTLLGDQFGRHLVDEIDRRLAKIPRFTGLKIFANGIQSISRLTANEYRDLMKVMVFVIDNLYNDTKDFVKNKELTEFYVIWNEMYIISRYEVFKESDLIKFRPIVTTLPHRNMSIFSAEENIL